MRLMKLENNLIYMK